MQKMVAVQIFEPFEDFNSNIGNFVFLPLTASSDSLFQCASSKNFHNDPRFVANLKPAIHFDDVGMVAKHHRTSFVLNELLIRFGVELLKFNRHFFDTRSVRFLKKTRFNNSAKPSFSQKLLDFVDFLGLVKSHALENFGMRLIETRRML